MSSSCIVVPKPALPTLPSPFGVSAPTIPGLKLNPKLCCNLLNLEVPAYPIPLPPLVLASGIVVAYRAATATVDKYFALLVLDCPRD